MDHQSSLWKLIEMKQQNERAGLGLAASPSGETECKMDSLRSIVKGLSNFGRLPTQPNRTLVTEIKKYLGDQIVQYSVLERVERLLEERFGNELVDHFIPEHFIPFAKKPVRVSIDPTHFSVVLTHVGAILKNFL